MAKSIDDFGDIGREPIAADLLVVETADGTRKMQYSRVKQMFQLKKLPVFVAAGGETVIPVPGLSNGVFTVMWQGVTPLDEWLDPVEPVPAGKYRVNTFLERLELGTAMQPGETALVIFY